jgi:hypothetical protein
MKIFQPIVTGSLSTSGSIFFPSLVTSSIAVNNVVMYGTSGQLFITSSNAIGGGSNTGSFTGSFTGSLFGTASYVTGSVFTSTNPALTSSFAATASYVIGIRSGAVGAGGFSGTPLTSSFITFSPSFPDTSYSVVITGTQDARNWTIVNKEATRFRIATNSSVAIGGNVMWVAIYQTQ